MRWRHRQRPASWHGRSEHGRSEHGRSEHGRSEHGRSEHGRCRCGWRCGSGATLAGGAGGAAPGSCGVVATDHGDCATALGWAYDGTGCRAFSGCGCEPDCGAFFTSAADCATACAAEGGCNLAALAPGGIAATFESGSYCDEVFACGTSQIEEDLGALVPLTSACEATSACPILTCPTSLTGVVDATDWQSACAASLLPDVTLTCRVYGP